MATVQGSGTQADPWTRWVGGAWEFWRVVSDGNTYYARVGAYFEITDYEPMNTDYWVDDVDPDGTYGLAYDGNYGLQGTCTSVGRVEIKLCAFNEDEGIDDATWIYIQILPAPTYTHTIAYNANGGSGSMGSTTVTDTNSGNTNVTFASNGFTAPTGHYFAGWRINNTGTVYQPGNTYPVGGNGSVTAYAYWLPNSYTVSATVSPANSGSVSGTGSYTYGSTANISATPNSGYRFVQWSDGNTSASRSITVTGNVSLSASFELEPTIATTNVRVNGVWTQGSVYVKVNGAWVESKKIYVKVNGNWVEGS